MDNTPRFDLGFDGNLQPGTDPQAARAHLKRVFKLSETAVERLFSGRRCIVKHAADNATRAQFERVFEAAGAILNITPLADEADGAIADKAPSSSRSEPAVQKEHPAPKPALALAPDQEAPLEPPLTAQQSAIDTKHLSLVDDPDWSLADCAPAPQQAEYSAPDISHLTLVDDQTPSNNQ